MYYVITKTTETKKGQITEYKTGERDVIWSLDFASAKFYTSKKEAEAAKQIEIDALHSPEIEAGLVALQIKPKQSKVTFEVVQVV